MTKFFHNLCQITQQQHMPQKSNINQKLLFCLTLLLKVVLALGRISKVGEPHNKNWAKKIFPSKSKCWGLYYTCHASSLTRALSVKVQAEESQFIFSRPASDGTGPGTRPQSRLWYSVSIRRRIRARIFAKFVVLWQKRMQFLP